MKTRSVVVVLAAVFLVSLVASYSLLGPAAPSSVSTSSSSSSVSSNSSASTLCSQPSGVTKVQLPATNFGEVTTYALPQPLKGPNSIVAAPDGSVWFGEVTLRGVAHLFLNGTLVEYAWPSSFVTPTTYCPDLNELWGIVLWHGMVWASDSANDQLVGLIPSNDTFRTIPLANGTLPRYLAIDDAGNLWFTESSTHSQIGVLASPTSAPRYFDVPAGTGEITASILFYNSSLAYVVTVNQSNNAGQVFSFDPEAANPEFLDVGSNQTLLAPYSVAAADGGLWVGEHDASDVAFYNETSSSWSFYPTSLNPEVHLTLPYYLVANGTTVWFNEHDSNRIAELTGTTSLTEFNISSIPLGNPVDGGIGNALTVALEGNLLWFTEWTGNEVGFVNASITPPFSVSSPANSTTTYVSPGASASVPLSVTGSTNSILTVQFSDSEYHTAVPQNLSISSNVTTIDGLSGTRTLEITISAKPGTPPGQYLVLVTVTDSMTYRSVYIPVDVT